MKRPDFDVIVVGAGAGGAAAAYYLTQAGLRVPEDIAVVGFDDIRMSSFLIPSLTTVHHPVKEMANQAISLLLDLIDEKNPNIEKSIIKISPDLIIRGSTGPLI